MPKRGPNVLVTGTPGTGKTSLCELVVQRFPLYTHVNVGEVVKAKGLHTGVDATFGAYMIDEANEDKIVDELEAAMAEGCVLLEHHSVDFFPERWFDLVLVLRTDNTVLFDRLTKRGYTSTKVTENVECEIMGVVLEEAVESYPASPPQVMQSNSLEDMESNVGRVVAWLRENSLKEGAQEAQKQ